jgi:hypothetical protein
MISGYKQEFVQRRTVKYTGSDALKKGYAVCWNRDSTTVLDPGATSGAATVSNWNRHVEVEKPASGNLHNFAGFVSQDYAAVTGGRDIEILIPRKQVLDVYTNVNCTAGTSTLCVQPGSYILGTLGTGVPVATVIQTVNRSVTNGRVQAICDMPDPLKKGYHTAAGRLCSPVIWETCPTELLRAGDLDGFDYFNDFLGNYTQATNLSVGGVNAMKENGFVAFTSATGGADSSITMAADAPYGVVQLKETTVDETVCLCGLGGSGSAGQVVFETGKRTWFEARVKVSTVAADDIGVFCGFGEEGLCVTVGVIGADDALTSKDLVGFHRLGGGTTAIGTYARNAGQALITVDATAGTIAADTWVKLGIYCDGTTVYFYMDGVLLSESVTLATANFPDGEEMCFYLAGTSGATAGNSVISLDWMRAAVLR